jgi:glutathione S-transferase
MSSLGFVQAQEARATHGRSAMTKLTALVTLLALLLYFWMGLRVGQARRKFGVKPPATTGNPDFERVFRVQMNTLEWMPIFLPALWLAAVYVSDIGAALVGLVWIVGRVIYMLGYGEAAEKRHLGFSVQVIAAGVLWLAALIGVVMSLARA